MHHFRSNNPFIWMRISAISFFSLARLRFGVGGIKRLCLVACQSRNDADGALWDRRVHPHLAVARHGIIVLQMSLVP